MTFKALLALALAALPALVNGTEQAWRFRVFLDDREIGYHDFRVRDRDGFQLLETEANFEYKLLFLTLYEYAHENTELWNGNCLAGIESFTDANGDPYEISGKLTGDGFLLEKSDGQAQLPACIMSFAYWNPAFLEQDRLLNSQNGDFVDVDVSAPERVSLQVRDSVRPALRYRLEAEGLRIDLYYSENEEWLALEADAAGGRKLRYELI